MARLIASNQLTLTNVNDGQTAVVHFAYSDNADGTGLTTSDNGQRYIGHYSDYTQADSTDKTKYKWADRWAKIEVGASNLYKTSTAVPGYLNGSDVNNGLGPRNATYNEYTSEYIELTDIDKLVLQTWVTVPKGGQNWVAWQFYGSNKQRLGSRPTTSTAYKVLESETLCHSKDNLTVPADAKYLRVSARLYADGKIKIERGTVPTDWTQAPEDVEDQISSKADQALTEQQLNLLTEKAQQLQVELDARATMEALSDLERAYNAYVKDNDQSVTKSQEDLINAGRRVDAIVETLGGLKKTKEFIDTYITEANEGIVIGTNDNVSQIRVTHNRIAMYSAGKEVMYISQGVIHIDNGVFTKSLQIGRFVTSQHESNPDINICRYVW